MILKIVIIAIICVFISSCLKQTNSEFSSIVSVCGGVLIFLLCISELSKIVDYFTEIYGMTNLKFDFISVVMKIVGVGYITEFASDIAEDFGNHVISSKVLLGGKIVICGMTLPIIKNLLSILLSFLS
jgi:stage III sporulation protein AD